MKYTIEQSRMRSICAKNLAERLNARDASHIAIAFNRGATAGEFGLAFRMDACSAAQYIRMTDNAANCMPYVGQSDIIAETMRQNG